MDINISYIRTFFAILCVVFSVFYTAVVPPEGFEMINVLIGLLLGIAFAGILIGIEYFLHAVNVRTFNITALGILFGYLMGYVFSTVIQEAADIAGITLGMPLVKMFIYFIGIYFGVVITLRSSEELHLSIPYVRFKQVSQKKKDILLDASIFLDTRIIDMASSGLFDNHLILPRFILKDLYADIESEDDIVRSRARRSLDVVKRLESLESLEMRIVDTDFPEVNDPIAKLIRLARLLDANIITADLSRIEQSTIESTEGLRIINLRSLANALKPLTQSGECINIKIQRYGKESRQGVGYLEDGTMVVVNGGAEYLGETIKAQVLSVKHTSSGRMIFCNAAEENGMSDDDESSHTNGHFSHASSESSKGLFTY